ncbi:RNA-directed DNA polymerase [Candidatus Woesearchaeota archaeon]|nr:reverse transcriptase family protein [bacterium]NQU79165.1 RNA-directed DNA polymerase [Candidatus Woesearchaeota archaeon]
MSRRKIESLLGEKIEYLEHVASKVGNYYKPFDIYTPGKKPRHIDNPNSDLKKIQKKIKSRVLETVILPETMMGGIKDKSHKDNALRHIDKKVVITLDLKSYFPKTNNRNIYDVFINVFGCNRETAHLFTKLTSYQRRLPQGAPSSTLLANMCVLPMHNDLQELFNRNDITWTFYIDDIAFSGDNADKVIDEAIKIIQNHGQGVSCKKKKIMYANNRQMVTKLCVNRKVGIKKEKINKIREDIINLSWQPNIDNRKLQAIKGSINYVKSICAVRGQSLDNLYKKMLPAKTGLIGKKPKIKTTSCKCSKKHREYVKGVRNISNKE